MKRFIWIAIIVVLAVGGFFGYREFTRAQAAASSDYQFATLEKGNLTAYVGATGTVRANQTAVLAWQTTGTVETIAVKVGDHVKKGDILARLDKTTLSQSIILAEADLVTAERNLDSLMNSSTAQAQAELALVQAQNAYNDLKDKVGGLIYPRGTQTGIDNAEAQYTLAKNNYSRAVLMFKHFQNLDPENTRRAEAQTALTNAQIAMDNALATLNYLKGTPDEETVADLKAQLALAEAQVQDAQREWDRLKNGPDPKDIAAAQARVDAIQATLRMSYIEAPFDATVTDISSMAGDQVAPGTTAFRLDDFSHQLVDVEVTEVDINRVQLGQSVEVSFDAILSQQYNGKVLEVAQVGQAVQGVVNFKVTVELTDADEAVRPGMTAAVNIVTNEIKDILLVPNRAVRLVSGSRVVYMLKNGAPTAVEITLGATSDTYSELVSGEVKAGDAVILNPPSTLMTPGSGNRSFFTGGR